MLANIQAFALMAKVKLRELFTDEKGEVNIVAIVVLIGIAVLLALIFKDEVKKLIESLFGTINQNAQSAVGGDAGGE